MPAEVRLYIKINFSSRPFSSLGEGRANRREGGKGMSPPSKRTGDDAQSFPKQFSETGQGSVSGDAGPVVTERGGPLAPFLSLRRQPHHGRALRIGVPRSPEPCRFLSAPSTPPLSARAEYKTCPSFAWCPALLVLLVL